MLCVAFDVGQTLDRQHARWHSLCATNGAASLRHYLSFDDGFRIVTLIVLKPVRSSGLAQEGTLVHATVVELPHRAQNHGQDNAVRHLKRTGYRRDGGGCLPQTRNGTQSSLFVTSPMFGREGKERVGAGLLGLF